MFKDLLNGRMINDRICSHGPIILLCRFYDTLIILSRLIEGKEVIKGVTLAP